MSSQPAITFGELLQRYRGAAGLSQEGLAERAGLSARGISDLERGLWQVPHATTIHRLAEALGLTQEQRNELLQTGARPKPAARSTRLAEESSSALESTARLPLPLPTGTVTFLFTDIEGSTRLLEQHPHAYPAALARHEAILRRAIERYGGVVFETVGDAVYAAFARAQDAVAAAEDAQLALHTAAWGELGALRVRMALHTGDVEQRGEHYFGPALYRCARLMATGHGGQVLLSGATADLVRDGLPADAALRALGTHRLKDLAEPEHVFQLMHPGLPHEFPRLQSAALRHHGIPVQATPLIGRFKELEELTATGRRSELRLLTLTGPGGVGKTRLAVAVAEQLAPLFMDGSCFVDLSVLANPDLVVPAIADVLGVREIRGQAPTSWLGDYLRERQVLLVLDNCEHLVQSCAELLDALLRDCTELKVLATSREPLRVRWEQLYPVPPLALADSTQPSTADVLRNVPAVALFTQRARAVQPTFDLSADNAPAVAELCARLDGLPLAIELAAARINILTPEQIAARLDDRFRLLTRGDRTAPLRQQTLSGAVEWSYNLLPDGERQVFRCLSAFAGGSSLELAEMVCAGDGVDQRDVFDLIGQLVSKSLVLSGTRNGHARYAMLETLREYGHGQLIAQGELQLMRDRHADALLALAERAESCLRGPENEMWLGRLEMEHDNLRSALEWLLQCRDLHRSQRLGGALVEFWHARGHFVEARNLLERIIDLGGEDQTIPRAKVLAGAGLMADYLGDLAAARPRYMDALTIGRANGDTEVVADCLRRLSDIAELTGQLEDAAVLLDEMLKLSRDCNNRWQEAASLQGLGRVAFAQGDCARAREFLRAGLTIFSALGDERASAGARLTLAHIAMTQNEDTQAEATCRSSLETFRSFGDRLREASCLSALGCLARRRRDFAASRALQVEALQIRLTIGDQDGITWTLREFALLAAEQGDLEQAIRFSGAVSALRERLGAPFPWYGSAWYERVRNRAREVLGTQAADAAWAAGRAMDRESVITEALLSPGRGSDSDASPACAAAPDNGLTLASRNGRSRGHRGAE